MKNRKFSRIISLVLSLLMVISTMPVSLFAATADETGQGNEIKDIQTASEIPELPDVAKDKGVIVSIEDYDKGEFVLEPVRIGENPTRKDLFLNAFKASGVKDAVVQEATYDWCLDLISNVQGIEAEEADGSNDIKNKAWMLFQNNEYDLWGYTNWKKTDDNTVVRLAYTVNKAEDLGFTGQTSGTGSFKVNKDELIRSIADARAKYPSAAKAIAESEKTVLDSKATEEDVKSAISSLQNAIDASDAAQNVAIEGEKTRSVNAGETISFTAVKEPADAKDELVWSVDNDIATIDKTTGVFSALKPGTVHVTVTAGSCKDTVTVDIKAPATGLEVDQNKVEIAEKKSVKVTATVSPEYSTDKAEWSVKDEKIAKVSQDGTITGVKAGETEVTVTAGKFTKTINVTVRSIPATEIVLDKTSVRIPMRQSEKINVKEILPSDTTETEVTWTSLDGTIAAVSQDGTITAGNFPGETTVVAQAGKASAKVEVEVYRIPSTGITAPEKITVKERATADLSKNVTVVPSESTDLITWRSLNEDVAKVDDKGVVTGIKAGDAEIIATAGEHHAKISVTVTEGVYVYFEYADGREDAKVDPESKSIYLSASDAGGHFRVANYDGDVYWDCEEHTDETGNSYYFISTLDGKLNGDVGKSWITAIVGDEVITFDVYVRESEVEKINLKVDGKTVDEKNPLTVEGFVNKAFQVEGTDKDGTTSVLAPEAVDFESLDTDKVRVSQDGRLKFTGTGKATVRATVKGNSKVTATAVIDIKPVPVKEVNVIINEGAKPYKINYWNFLGDYYVGAQPYQQDGYTIEYVPGNTTERDVVWTPLTPEIATHMEEFSNGIIPKRAGTAKFKVTSAVNPEVTTTVSIDFVYQTPLEKVQLKKDKYEVGVSNTVPLEADFVPGNATEQRFDWSYSKDGIVEIQEDVKGDGPYKYFEHHIIGKKAGTVTVTGTPMDITKGCKPIEFTVKVGNGGAELSKVTGLNDSIRHGIDNIYGPGIMESGNEWGIFTLARAGYKFTDKEIKQYVESVNTRVNNAIKRGRELPPADYSTIVMALTALGQNPETSCDVNLIEKLYNYKNLRNPVNYTSNMMMWTLIALDSHEYKIPADAVNTRENLVKEILKYQRSNGGFNLVIKGDDAVNMLDLTGMAIQALEKYRDQPEVKAAIDKGIEYMRKRISPNAGFVNEGGENSCTSAQVIVALTSMDYNVLDPECGFVRNGKNIVSRIQKFERKGGFVLIEDGREPDGMSTYQVTYALEAFRRFQSGENSLYDLTDVKLNDESENIPDSETTEPEENQGNDNIVLGDGESSKVVIRPEIIKNAHGTITVKFENGQSVKYDEKAVEEIRKQLPEDTVNVKVSLEETHRNDAELNFEQLTALAKNKNNLGIFKITLTAVRKDGSETEISKFKDGTSEVMIDFEYTGNKTLQVVRVEKDGTFTLVKSSYKNGKLTFVTNGHSFYMVSEKGKINGTVNVEQMNNDNNTEEHNDNITSGGTTGNTTDGNITSGTTAENTPDENVTPGTNVENNAMENGHGPDTGDAAHTSAWIVLMLVAVAVLPVLRRKFNK